MYSQSPGAPSLDIIQNSQTLPIVKDTCQKGKKDLPAKCCGITPRFKAVYQGWRSDMVPPLKVANFYYM